MAFRDSPYQHASSSSTPAVQGKRKRTTKSMYEGEEDDDPLTWHLADELLHDQVSSVTPHPTLPSIDADTLARH